MYENSGGGGGREDICCRLFIGGLSPSVNSDSLRQHFSQFGTVLHCNVPKDPKTQRSRGYGFLTYKERQHVDEAQRRRPHVLDGRQVETKRAMPREEANNPEAHVTTKKLFVGALRKDITDQLLRDYFSSYGSIVDAYVVKDSASGESRGFGFVVFDDYDAVDKVILYKPHLLRAGNSVSITDVKKGLTKEELASAQLREQQSRGAASNVNGPPSGPHPQAGMMMPAGPWGPMMGPMMGGTGIPMGPGGPSNHPNQQTQQQQQGGKQQNHQGGKSKGPDPSSGGGSMPPYGPMAMMSMMGAGGPGPMLGPVGMMGAGGPMMGPMPMMGGVGPMGPMGPMGMMGPAGPMGMMGPVGGMPGPMGMMGGGGPGFGFYPNQCGGYGPMGRGGWGGFRSSPYSMLPPHRTRSNST